MLGGYDVEFYFTLWISLFGLVYHCNGQDDKECHDYTGYNSFRRFGDSCFYISHDSRTWNAAKEVCAEWKGNLATVATNETAGFLYNHIRFANQAFWIGLYINFTDLVYDNNNDTRRRQANWKWVDGTLYNYRDLPGWQNREPWLGDRLGLLRGIINKWAADASPLERHFYICETKLPQNTATQKTQEESDMYDEISRKYCAVDWTYSNAGHKCFKLVDSGNLLTWSAANSYCEEELSGLLACPSTKEYHDDVISVIRKAGKFTTNVWIGLQNPEGVKGPLSDISGRRSGWTWIDNSDYQYQIWSSNYEEPQQGEKYVRLHEGEWKGIPDYATFSYFLCQKDPQNSPAPTPDVTPPLAPPDAPPTQSPYTPAPDPDPATKDNPDQSGSDGGTKNNPAAADPNQVKRNGGEDGNKNSNKAILGPVIGGVAVLLVVAVVATVIVKCRGSGYINSLKKLLPFKKKEEETYCEINDNDVKTPRTPSAVYVNKPEYMHPPNKINSS